VTCGGQAGVSNTFASALWTLDTQFWMARAGVDSVDVHIHPEAPANQLFTFARRRGGWVGSVRPEYYGLLMFARAAPPGARLLSVAGRFGGALRAWATLGRDGRIRVVLINAGLTGALMVLLRAGSGALRVGSGAVRAGSGAVRAGSGAAPASLERLTAPSPYATGGVTLAGQSFGSRTLTGELRGRLSEGTVRASGSGGYRVRLPAASAVMLTIPAR
jgi:hypothetical protein